MTIPLHGWACILVAVTTAASVVSASAVAEGAGLTWAVEIVDSDGESGHDASLAVAGNGTLHALYRDAGGTVLRLATRSAGAWSFETVAGPGMFAGDTSLELGYGGGLHILFYDAAAGNFRYGTRDAAGGPWLLGDVDAGSPNGYSALRIDRYGIPHVAYAWTNGTLRYARFSDGFWIREPVDPVTLLVRYVSLDVDRDGRPHLAYYGRGQLRYATKPGLVWSVEVVDPRERAGWFGQIALDLSGRPHLAYYDSVDGNLWYATPDGSDWSRTRVDGSGDAGWDASLAIDPGGRPVIAYYARIPSDLRYARLDNGTWTVQVVDEEGVTGWEPSLAVGPDGTPHVAFHDWTLGALKLASGRDVLGVRTVAPSGVTTSGARLHGEVTALGPYAVANASFEWRKEGDAAWTIVEALPVSEGAKFEAHLGGLGPGTTYEFRAVAEAGGASAYGRIITFLTTAPERVDLYPMFFTGLSIAVLATGVGLALWIWFLHPARVTRRGGRRPGGSV